MVILNQKDNPRCSAYALLGALQHVDPSVNIESIIPLINESNVITMKAAENLFKSYGLIEGLQSVEVYGIVPLLRRGEPVLIGANDVDWDKVRKPPYMLSFKPEAGAGITGHFWYAIRLVNKDTVEYVNSWGETFGDQGRFYGPLPRDKRGYKGFYKIIPKRSEEHNDIVRQYEGKSVDVDGAYGAQCVDWVRAYTNSRKRYITNYGNAYDLWTKGLGPNWYRIEKTATNAPEEGDVILWDKTWGGGYGHIAIANKYCMPVGVMRYIDQNGGKGTGTGKGADSIQNRWGTYKGVVGWCRWVK